MNIGLLTTSFPRHRNDVAGHFVLGFARALCARGHTVEVLAPEPATPSAPPPWPDIHVQYVPYLRPRALQRTFYGAGVPDNLRRDPAAWLGLLPFSLSLLNAARRRAPRWDAVVSHWALPCALAAGAVRLRGARGPLPHVAVLHSADIHLLSKLPARALLTRRIAREADTLWFVSEAQRARYLALLPGEPPASSVVCPMGIDLPVQGPLSGPERLAFRRRHGLQGFCVLTLGRHVPIKGLDVALRAAANGGMTWLIAGDGPERPRLMHEARALGATVRFIGPVFDDDKRAWLSAADAFALPSRRLPDGRSEGLPCALLEALAYGLPVVASRLPGITELLEEHGLHEGLVHPEDPDALHAALLRARDQPRARDVQQHREPGLAARYGWDRVGEQIGALLEHR
ncbi:MAG: glycosyltransferase [Polyangiales bacterium]